MIKIKILMKILKIKEILIKICKDIAKLNRQTDMKRKTQLFSIKTTINVM